MLTAASLLLAACARSFLSSARWLTGAGAAWLFFLITLASLASVAQAAVTVSNVRATQRPGTHLVDIYYDLADAGAPGATIAVTLSGDSGTTYGLPISTFTGAIGTGITTGTDRHIVWDARADRPDIASATMRLRVTATAMVVPAITTTPSAVTVTAGASASFTAAASGTPVPNVQWQVSTDGGTTFTDLAGATSATYSLTTAVGDNGKRFRAVFTNSAGSTPTTAAILTVNLGSDRSGFAFATIPAGAFQMGDSFTEGYPEELPVHTVTLSAFMIARTEMTYAEWQAVSSWALVNGYPDPLPGTSQAENHPVQSVSWHDIVKWCNAASERDGLVPVYRLGSARGVVYRTGNVEPVINYANNGYRLPTEAEWEKAARGGLSGKRFPWGDTISHSQANYSSNEAYPYDISPTRANHPSYQSDGLPYTSPVGSFAANGYGLYDMTGNVWEWCADWYGLTYYASSPGSNPPGPTTSSVGNRIIRGGSWSDNADYSRVAFRGTRDPRFRDNTGGFRLARTAARAPAFTSTALATTLTTGTAYAATLAADGSPAPAFAVATGSLPPGLTLDSATGEVSGAPTTTGNYSGTFSATNATGSVVQAFSLTVNPSAAPAITAAPNDLTVTAGATANFTAAASGAPAPLVSWQVSTDSGATFSTISGASGATYSFTTTVGDHGKRFRAIFTNSVGSATTSAATLTVQAGSDRSGFALASIPAGEFPMGNGLTEGFSTERPVHAVSLVAYSIGRTEMTYAEWQTVRTWGLSNGYTDLDPGDGKAADHPVRKVSWYDVVKWCNAASERAGLVPVYRVESDTGAVYRTGEIIPVINYANNGYRLPTEAEWEKAACGSLSGKRFPWGDTITHAEANYFSDATYAYDVSPTRSHHPSYQTGGTPFTSPVGSFAANGYGLYDMAGNVSEWCADWFGSTYYTSSPSSDPRGPTSGTGRSGRGGSWDADAFDGRAAARSSANPTLRYDTFGFRIARNQ